jgi:hypothetical protein
MDSFYYGLTLYQPFVFNLTHTSYKLIYAKLRKKGGK